MRTDLLTGQMSRGWTLDWIRFNGVKTTQPVNYLCNPCTNNKRQLLLCSRLRFYAISRSVWTVYTGVAPRSWRNVVSVHYVPSHLKHEVGMTNARLTRLELKVFIPYTLRCLLLNLTAFLLRSGREKNTAASPGDLSDDP